MYIAMCVKERGRKGVGVCVDGGGGALTNASQSFKPRLARQAGRKEGR
jgi:hypothetical protein